MKVIAAGEFKQRCLSLLDDVGASGEPIVITRRGKPVAPRQSRPSALRTGAER